MGLIPENITTVKRGESVEKFDFMGYEVVAKVKIMTNREVDNINKEFTEMLGGIADIDVSGLIEERIVRGLLDINTTHQGKPWTELTTEEKREWVTVCHPELREKIAGIIMGAIYLTPKEKHF